MSVNITFEQLTDPTYQPPEGYCWFMFRVTYGRARQLYDELKDKQDGYILWFPCEKRVTYNQGRKYEELQPMFKSNLFIFTTFTQAIKLTRRGDGLEWVDFVYDRTHKNQAGRHEPLRIPFGQMSSFVRAANVMHPWAHIVSEEEIKFRPGGLVRITEGQFQGVVGRVARVKGQTRVVITILGVGHYCTAYVSGKCLEPCEE